MIRSPVVISIGDPSGIGPEVFLKSIINTELRDNLEKITVICDPRVLTNTLSGLDESLEINIVADHNQNARDAVNVICSEQCPCLLYTSPSPRDATLSRMPSSA